MQFWGELSLKHILTVADNSFSSYRRLDLTHFSFRLDHFDGLIPFDFKTEPAESNSKYLGELSTLNAANMINSRRELFCTSCIFCTMFLSEPAVHGAHLLLQRPFVCCCGEEAGVGLRSHHNTSPCNGHQSR